MNNDFLINNLINSKLPEIKAPIYKEQLRRHLISSYLNRETFREKLIKKFKLPNIITKIILPKNYQKKTSYNHYTIFQPLVINFIGYDKKIINTDSTSDSPTL